MPEAGAICDFSPKKQALLHDILERIADKWTLLVIEALDGEGEMRFSGLQRRVGQISHKMLTKTLRQLERDGLVTRRVHAEVPPRVDYKLTELGESLCESLCGVWTWVGQHMPEVERARRVYDRNGKRANERIPRVTAGLGIASGPDRRLVPRYSRADVGSRRNQLDHRRGTQQR